MRRLLGHRSVALHALASLFAIGCGGGAGDAPDASVNPSDAASNAPTATTSAASGQAPPAPDDLDLASIQKALKCANDGHGGGACGVLAKFGTCKPWNAVTPSGEGRWLGRGYSVEKGKTTDVFVTVISRRVGTAEVGPGQVGAKIAVDELPKSEAQPYEAAERAIRILERQDVAPRFNAALDYVKKRTSSTESFATKTAGGQVYLLTKGGGFACLGPKQEVLVAVRSATRGAGTAGDGLYAEVWGITW